MTAGRRLRVGLVVPTEAVSRARGIRIAVANLARGLHELGHEVLLFTAEDDPAPSQLVHPSIGPIEVERLARSVYASRQLGGFDEELADCAIIHDHTVAGPFLRHQRRGIAVVATNHGLFDSDVLDAYRQTGYQVPVIAVSHDQASRAPHTLEVEDVIHHGVDLARYPFRPEAGRYLVTFGAFQPAGGASIETAVEVARHVGLPLRIAAPLRTDAEHDYYEAVVEPLLDDHVEYVGDPELTDRAALLGGALAMLHPIRWPEPFGLTAIESMACGTPVISCSAGSAPEIIADGETGIIADRHADLIAAAADIGSIDRRRCRRHVEQRFTMHRMALDHERLYRRLIDHRTDRSNVVFDFPSRPLTTSGRGTPRNFPVVLPAN